METEERTSTRGDGSVRWTVGDLPAERLEAEIVTLAERLSVGTYELLVLVGELDARGTWAAWGALSCAGWLADPRAIWRSRRRARRCGWPGPCGSTPSSTRRCAPVMCPMRRPGCWCRT